MGRSQWRLRVVQFRQNLINNYNNINYIYVLFIVLCTVTALGLLITNIKQPTLQSTTSQTLVPLGTIPHHFTTPNHLAPSCITMHHSAWPNITPHNPEPPPCSIKPQTTTNHPTPTHTTLHYNTKSSTTLHNDTPLYTNQHHSMQPCAPDVLPNTFQHYPKLLVLYGNK